MVAHTHVQHGVQERCECASVNFHRKPSVILETCRCLAAAPGRPEHAAAPGPSQGNMCYVAYLAWLKTLQSSTMPQGMQTPLTLTLHPKSYSPAPLRTCVDVGPGRHCASASSSRYTVLVTHCSSSTKICAPRPASDRAQARTSSERARSVARVSASSLFWKEQACISC